MLFSFKINTSKERQIDQFTLFIGIVGIQGLVQAKRGQSLQVGGTHFVLVREPNHVTTDKVLVEEVDVVGGHQQLWRTFAVGEEKFDEIGEQFIVDAGLYLIDRNKIVFVQLTFV